jgi:hypothetical protein
MKEEWSSQAEEEFHREMKKLASLKCICNVRRVKIANRILKYRQKIRNGI